MRSGRRVGRSPSGRQRAGGPVGAGARRGRARTGPGSGPGSGPGDAAAGARRRPASAAVASRTSAGQDGRRAAAAQPGRRGPPPGVPGASGVPGRARPVRPGGGASVELIRSSSGAAPPWLGRSAGAGPAWVAGHACTGRRAGRIARVARGLRRDGAAAAPGRPPGRAVRGQFTRLPGPPHAAGGRAGDRRPGPGAAPWPDDGLPRWRSCPGEGPAPAPVTPGVSPAGRPIRRRAWRRGAACGSRSRPAGRRRAGH